MSLLISCSKISKTFGIAPLFQDLSLTIHKNEKIGLIGTNGCGKSTLLKILSRRIQPDTGEISVKKDVQLVYLAQEDTFDPQDTIESFLLKTLAGDHLDDEERFTRSHFWMGQAGFEKTDQLIESLSGGWKKRLSIVAAFMLQPDLLLLDEPTNHLDLEGILWLEDLLNQTDFSYVLVSHDRYFLENVCNKTIELGKQYPEGYFKIDGNYSNFLEQKEIFLQGQQQAQSVLSNKVRRETEWLRRGPKARTSKARFRIDEAYRLQDELSEVKERNRDSGSVKIDFNSTERKTKRLIEVKEAAKALGGKQLFENVSFVLSPGTNIGLLGVNGSGKSTLMNILSGTLDVDKGSVTRADKLQVVLFDQKRDQLDQNQTLKRALAPTGDSVIYRGKSIHLVTWAKRFLFKPEQLELPISKLSGGEQARILIARMMLQPADVLLLDEPTNDLDIPSLQVLEDSLMDFPGAIILVTHDRYLLDRVSTTILGLSGEAKGEFFADYTQWLDHQKPKKAKVAVKTEKPKKQAKLSYKDQRELDQIEELILQHEGRMEECNEKISDSEISTQPDKLEHWCQILKEEQEKTEALYHRWEELEALKQSLENND